MKRSDHFKEIAEIKSRFEARIAELEEKLRLTDAQYAKFKEESRLRTDALEKNCKVVTFGELNDILTEFRLDIESQLARIVDQCHDDAVEIAYRNSPNYNPDEE